MFSFQVFFGWFMKAEFLSQKQAAWLGFFPGSKLIMKGELQNGSFYPLFAFILICRVIATARKLFRTLLFVLDVVVIGSRIFNFPASFVS